MSPLNKSGYTQDGNVADAVAGNWVDTIAPEATRPYLRLSRADRPIGMWLLLIPCWWGITLSAAVNVGHFAWYDLWLMIACTLGAFLMRGAGCTWNDLADQEFDAAVARTRSRPLPSGQVTRKQAKIWMCAQALAAFFVLMTFPWPAIGLGILSLGLVAVYPFAKRFTWWPQIFLGLAFNWGAMLGWVAQSETFSLAPVFLYVAGVFWTLFYDTIYAHQDKVDDARIGVKSTARLFGDDTMLWLIGFMCASIFFMITAMVWSVPSAKVIILGSLGASAFGAHLLWQLSVLDIDDEQNCLNLFRSNRLAGLLVVAALLVAVLS